MWTNYLKTALRNLRRRKGYAFLNVTGLATGVACCLLIGLYVRDELSYDRFFAEADRIYRVNLEPDPDLGVDRGIAFTPPIAAPLLAREFPSVERAVRILAWGGVVRYEDRIFEEDRFYFADSSFFDVFDRPFLYGDPGTALARPNTVVLTAPTAERYFGDENPVGHTIVFDDEEEYEVTGVVEPLPHNTHFGFDFVAPYASLGGVAQRETWSSANYYTYLLLHDGSDAAVLERQIDAFVEGLRAGGEDPRALDLMPLTRIHLYADLAYALDRTGDIRYVWILSAMAVLILLIACVNYTNLATARAAERAREVGVRKALGANRMQLAQQLYGESLLLVLGALLLALGLVGAGLPLFNALSGKSLAFGDLPLGFVLAALGGIGLIVSLVAGSYPALLLSGFDPARVLKGTFRSGQGAARFRRALVVFQFAASAFLIASTFVVRGQLGYLQAKNLGFDKEHVVVLPIDDATLETRYPALEDAFRQHAGVLQTAAVNQYPSALGWTSYVDAEGISEDARPLMKGFITGRDVVGALGLELLAGRGFGATTPHPDSAEAGYRYLLNETALQRLGWSPDEALGKRFNMLGGREGEVVGVVADFHYASLHDVIEPLAIWYHPDEARHLLVRLAPSPPGSDRSLSGTLDFMRERWAELAPHRPFTYRFMDDAFDALYRDEQRVGRVFGAFALLAVFVACLGLFGLAAYTAQQRTKEIGIRKVLGASASSIVALLSTDFLQLVLLGFVLAAPLAYLAARHWLQDFAYRIELGPGIFLVAGAAMLTVALLTVSVQSIRAAGTDPAESLRHE